jgi:quercetin dioxygenase-like cupin family protein
MDLLHGKSNVYSRPNVLRKKGDQIEGHKHNFDHLTIVTRGSVRIKAKKPDGSTPQLDVKSTEYWPLINIEAGVEHEITALEDDSAFICVYAHRNPQGEVVQEYNKWDEAYA